MVGFRSGALSGFVWVLMFAVAFVRICMGVDVCCGLRNLAYYYYYCYYSYYYYYYCYVLVVAPLAHWYRSFPAFRAFMAQPRFGIVGALEQPRLFKNRKNNRPFGGGE